MKFEIAQLLGTIEQAKVSPNDNALFKLVIEQTLSLGVTTKTELAIYFMVSEPTIHRWSEGTSAPHPLGRPTVYRRINMLIGQKYKGG